MRVLQVRRGVAFERQHPIPVEDVVLDPIGRQVGVLQRADADHPADLDAARRRAGRGSSRRTDAVARSMASSTRSTNRTGSPLRLFSILRSLPSTLPKATCTASAGGTQPAGHRGDVEHHRKVLRLRRADDVDEQRRLDPLDAVEHTGQVAGAVVEPAAALLHDQRQRIAVAVRVAGREHDIGAVALLQQPGCVEPLDDLGQQVVVHALAGEVVVGQQHAELAVQPIEVGACSGRRAASTAAASRDRRSAATRRDCGRGPGTRRWRRTSPWPACRSRRDRRR